MLESLDARGRVMAEQRAQTRIDALAAALRDAVPRGVEVTAEAGAVVLSGRDIGRRFAGNPDLLWLTARVR